MCLKYTYKHKTNESEIYTKKKTREFLKHTHKHKHRTPSNHEHAVSYFLFPVKKIKGSTNIFIVSGNDLTVHPMQLYIGFEVNINKKKKERQGVLKIKIINPTFLKISYKLEKPPLF